MLRLADRQGLFHTKKISRFQQWALSYLIVLERKENFDSIYDQQEFLFSLINPKLYQKVVSDRLADPDILPGDENITSDNLSEIDQWLKELHNSKSITAGEL